MSSRRCSCAGAKRRGRVFEARSRFLARGKSQMSAHLACAVAKAARISSIREDSAATNGGEKSPDTGGIESFRLMPS